MSVEKSELKILIMNNVGADIEDRLEGAERTVHQLEGSMNALSQAAQTVPSQMCAKVEVLLGEGKVIKDGMTALEVAELLKKYINKCGDFLTHLSQVAGKKLPTQQGEVVGLQVAIDIVKSKKEVELQNVRDIAAHLDTLKSKEAAGEEVGESARGTSRPSGVRPGKSSLADRRKEAKKDKASVKKKPGKKKGPAKKKPGKKVEADKKPTVVPGLMPKVH
jgi:hypothetical protein